MNTLQKKIEQIIQTYLRGLSAMNKLYDGPSTKEETLSSIRKDYGLESIVPYVNESQTNYL